MQPKRKQNRHPTHDYSEKRAYFITICTKNKNHYFGTIKLEEIAKVQLNENGEKAKNKIEKIKEIKKYIIMPNHLHMIIETIDSEKTIIQIIRNLKSSITKKIGYPIWQKSYHDRIIRNDKEYEAFWHYIEHNAETWREDKYYSIRNEK